MFEMTSRDVEIRFVIFLPHSLVVNASIRSQKVSMSAKFTLVVSMSILLNISMKSARSEAFICKSTSSEDSCFYIFEVNPKEISKFSFN